MYSVSLQGIDQRGSSPNWYALYGISALVICLLCFVPVRADQDGALVDAIEFENRPAIISGEPIVTSEDTESTAESDQTAVADEVPKDLDYTEYRFGSSTVREYRSGNSLLYIEIINDDGPVYVINQTGEQKPDSTRKRSGLVVTRW